MGPKAKKVKQSENNAAGKGRGGSGDSERTVNTRSSGGDTTAAATSNPDVEAKGQPTANGSLPVSASESVVSTEDPVHAEEPRNSSGLSETRASSEEDGAGRGRRRQPPRP